MTTRTHRKTCSRITTTFRPAIHRRPHDLPPGSTTRGGVLNHLASTAHRDSGDEPVAQLVVDEHAPFDVLASLQWSDDKIRRIDYGRDTRDRIELDRGLSRLHAIDGEVLAHALEHGAVKVDDSLPTV